MQIKAATGRHADILALERLLERPDIPAATRGRIETDIRNIRAGERGEQGAAYDIELWFGPSPNWATIHDLRFEVGGLIAQIDHIIINRLAEIWVCESKSFSEGVSVNEHGEWTRWWKGRPEGMPSPIEQNRRHVELLRRAFDAGLVKEPRRLGLVPMKPTIRSLVLVSNGARISRPKRKLDGLDQVIKADQLKARLFDEFDKVPDWRLVGAIGKDGLRELASNVVALHRPIEVDWSARFGVDPTPPRSSASPPLGRVDALQPSTPTAPSRPWHVKYDGPCSICGRTLAKGTPAIWDRSIGNMRCLDCSR